LDAFRHLIKERIILNVSLKTEGDIEATVRLFNDTIRWAGWNATQEHTDTLEAYDCPILIKQKFEENQKTQ
jgi:hypothetical protein